VKCDQNQPCIKWNNVLKSIYQLVSPKRKMSSNIGWKDEKWVPMWAILVGLLMIMMNSQSETCLYRTPGFFLFWYPQVSIIVLVWLDRIFTGTIYRRHRSVRLKAPIASYKVWVYFFTRLVDLFAPWFLNTFTLLHSTIAPSSYPSYLIHPILSYFSFNLPNHILLRTSFILSYPIHSLNF